MIRYFFITKNINHKENKLCKIYCLLFKMCLLCYIGCYEHSKNSKCNANGNRLHLDILLSASNIMLHGLCAGKKKEISFKAASTIDAHSTMLLIWSFILFCICRIQISAKHKRLRGIWLVYSISVFLYHLLEQLHSNLYL